MSDKGEIAETSEDMTLEFILSSFYTDIPNKKQQKSASPLVFQNIRHIPPAKFGANDQIHAVTKDTQLLHSHPTVNDYY